MVDLLKVENLNESFWFYFAIIICILILLVPKQPKLIENFCFLGIGDCGTTQTNVNDTVNTAITNVLNTNALNCAISTGVDQSIKISNINAGQDININGVNQTTQSKLDFSCLSNNTSQNDINNQLTGAVQSALDQKTSGFQFSASDQTQINTLKNNIVNNLNTNNITKCVANAYTNQNLLINQLNANRNVNIGDINQSATQTAVSNCTSSNSALNTAISALQNKIDVSNSQSATGAFASLASLTTVWIVAIIGVVVLSSASIGSLLAFSYTDAGQNSANQLTTAAIQYAPYAMV
jgi:hypothetical protein